MTIELRPRARSWPHSYALPRGPRVRLRCRNSATRGRSGRCSRGQGLGGRRARARPAWSASIPRRRVVICAAALIDGRRDDRRGRRDRARTDEARSPQSCSSSTTELTDGLRRAAERALVGRAAASLPGPRGVVPGAAPVLSSRWRPPPLPRSWSRSTPPPGHSSGPSRAPRRRKSQSVVDGRRQGPAVLGSADARATALATWSGPRRC